MERLGELLLLIFVITLYHGETCVCSTLDKSNDGNADIPVEDFRQDSEENTETSRQPSVDMFKNIKLYDLVYYYGSADTKTHVGRRVSRQAYGGTSLYPRLPTAPQNNYQQQPYQNQNYNYYGQSNYTNPPQQQWHPQNPSPGYQAYNPAYNNNYRAPNNPYDPQSAYNQVGPNSQYQQYNNTRYGPGYPSTNPASTNISPYGSSNNPQFSNYSGNPPYTTYGNNSFTANHRPPYYPSANVSNARQPNYPYNNPNYFYPSTSPIPYNDTRYRSNLPQYPTNWSPNRPTTTNTPHSYPSSPGYNNNQNNRQIPNDFNKYGVNSTYNFNGTQQRWPYKPTPNITNYYNQNYLKPGAGSIPYNNSNQFNPNQAMYPQPNQHQSNYYPNNQFNGTSTYRLAPTYIPNIPSQPPRNGPYQQNPSYYPSGPYDDPTKVAPNRFSY